MPIARFKTLLLKYTESRNMLENLLPVKESVQGMVNIADIVLNATEHTHSQGQRGREER